MSYPQLFHDRLVTDAQELIWLTESPKADGEDLIDPDMNLEDLVETLPARGNFNAGEWLYEQLCLEIPPHCLCKENCPGIQFTEASQPTSPADGRWASLQSLRDQLPH